MAYPARGTGILAALYLAAIVVLVPYAASYSPHNAVVTSVNGDPLFYDGEYLVVSNSSGTWVRGPWGWVHIAPRAIDACRLGDSVYLVTSRNPYIVELGRDGATGYRVPDNMPRPRAIDCGSIVVAVGWDSVRGAGLYLAGPGAAEAYHVYGWEGGIEDVGVVGGDILVVRDSIIGILRLDGLGGTLYNLSTPGWLVDLDLAQDGVLLGSLRRDPSRLALALEYPSLDAYVLEAVGRAAVAAAHTDLGGGRMLTLVRPAGTWAILVEWSRDGVHSVVSTVMSDAFTLTATGVEGSAIWQGGRLLGGMRSIVLESSSASRGLVGEGYRIIVNVEPYREPVIPRSWGAITMEPLAQLELGGPVGLPMEDLGAPTRVDVDVSRYSVDRDIVSLVLALASLSIPIWLGIVRVLEGDGP